MDDVEFLRNKSRSDFENYVSSRRTEYGLPLEMVKTTLFDTETYDSDLVRRNRGTLNFFQEMKKVHGLSNMLCPSMLPNPMAFLVEEMAISGVGPYIAESGVVRVFVGNKIMAELPLKLFIGERNLFRFSPCCVAIYPLQYFKVAMEWGERSWNGLYRPQIKVVLTGEMARSVA